MNCRTFREQLADLVAGELEVLLDRVGADGLLALGVKVGPPAAERHFLLDYDGVRLAGETRFLPLERNDIDGRSLVKVTRFIEYIIGGQEGFVLVAFNLPCTEEKSRIIGSFAGVSPVLGGSSQ